MVGRWKAESAVLVPAADQVYHYIRSTQDQQVASLETSSQRIETPSEPIENIEPTIYFPAESPWQRNFSRPARVLSFVGLDSLCHTFQTRYIPLKGETLEVWQKLCSQAATEQDPARLLELINEINRLLDEKEKRLQKQQGATAD